MKADGEILILENYKRGHRNGCIHNEINGE